MRPNEPGPIRDLLDLLAGDDLDDRVKAIQILGDIGDAGELKVLRERMYV